MLFPTGKDQLPTPPADQGRLRQVQEVLNRTVSLNIFNVADPRRPNTPITLPGDGSNLVGMDVNESLHRLAILAAQPGVSGFNINNRIGEGIATVSMKWRVIPDDFSPSPNGPMPPPTVLDPRRSQRFCMMGGKMTFDDPEGSYLRAFGCGRTFPVMIDGRPQLRLAATVDLLEGFGRFEGLAGTIVVNGHIEPPYQLALAIMIRLLDPSRRLTAPQPLPPLRPVINPDPESVYLLLRGSPDPAYPVNANLTQSGTFTGTDLHEILTLEHTDFSTQEGLAVRRAQGAFVGRLTGRTHIGLPSGKIPVPIQTSRGRFEFIDRFGRGFATLQANIVEGRAFPLQIPGVPGPIFRLGGFGPFLKGTGEFSGATGMVSVNSVICVDPQALAYSMLYMIRISDRDGRFRNLLEGCWCGT